MAQEFPAPEGPVQQFPAPVPPRRSNATVWIIVAVVLVLLCCVCLIAAGVILWQNGDSWFNISSLAAPYASLA
jgi:hypothetical protein